MKSISTILFFLSLFHIILSKFPDNKTVNDSTLYKVFSTKYLDFYCKNTKKCEFYEKYSKKYAFPNTIRFNHKGVLFMSVPRHLLGDKIDEYIPGTINYLNGTKLYPWPNEEENDFENGRIHSVVGFEIDLDGNLYLLNHRTDKLRELLVYNHNGTLKQVYNLTNATIHKNHESLLTNIVLDLTYKFAYIADTGKYKSSQFKEDDNRNNTKSNLIVLDLDTKTAIKFLQKHKSTLPDPNLDINKKNINNIGLYGLTLTCDKRFLYYSPLKSNKLYSVNTFYLQEERTIRNKDIKEYNKKASSFEMLSSARGLFYYTSIEENSVLINFYERNLMFETIRSVKHQNYLENYTPISLAFNGTTGFLYFLINRHHIFMNDNLQSELDNKQDNFFIFKMLMNDRSYLYPCNILSYVPSSAWIFIIGIALFFSYLVLKLIQYVVKFSPKEKEEKQLSEELVDINNNE